ncbi:hypothetical protein MGYG_08907 [Nannizzia gypsea CBS 118893]|uniref:Uncharacterized protein n=1 Tax=Arthroderma gypseum (strain ATCC MYA-4604 / CBS 118893) TaxID=535722 RepID=E5R2E0_ARTGP|nr:hypothetical protein MGYG_08907 [Nannizzia gypsea CBS 118893]EFQ97816.1 hypothetical protein MGYG_08907 [Nannizzia gypsea CBS 118893]
MAGTDRRREGRQARHRQEVRIAAGDAERSSRQRKQKQAEHGGTNESSGAFASRRTVLRTRRGKDGRQESSLQGGGGEHHHHHWPPTTARRQQAPPARPKGRGRKKQELPMRCLPANGITRPRSSSSERQRQTERREMDGWGARSSAKKEPAKGLRRPSAKIPPRASVLEEEEDESQSRVTSKLQAWYEVWSGTLDVIYSYLSQDILSIFIILLIVLLHHQSSSSSASSASSSASLSSPTKKQPPAPGQPDPSTNLLARPPATPGSQRETTRSRGSGRGRGRGRRGPPLATFAKKRIRKRKEEAKKVSKLVVFVTYGQTGGSQGYRMNDTPWKKQKKRREDEKAKKSKKRRQRRRRRAAAEETSKGTKKEAAEARRGKRVIIDRKRQRETEASRKVTPTLNTHTPTPNQPLTDNQQPPAAAAREKRPKDREKKQKKRLKQSK